MKFYFAPMEGITGYVYRNAHSSLFPGVDKYFTPFIATKQHGKYKPRELNDILPKHNPNIPIVPQVLTNNASDFLKISHDLKQYGYEEININLGCPSATVVSKYRGSGFLAKPDKLNEFLQEIFAHAETKISLKTRLGKDDPEEFYRLMELYNQYPLEELIIHPRIQTDFYKNTPNLTVFKDALSMSNHPICYNGDIFTSTDYETITSLFPNVQTIMLGRGLLTNPGLIHQIISNRPLDKTTIQTFHDKIYEDYQTILSGDRNVLFKMKEFWFYMIQMFEDHEKFAKKIRKSERLTDYNGIITDLFAMLEVGENAGYRPFLR